MSVAFYPRLGLFTFGSESSATKAGLGKSVPGSADAANKALFGAEFLDGFRFDLDDVNGEVMLLRWGKDSTGEELDASKHKLKEELADGKPKKASPTLTSTLILILTLTLILTPSLTLTPALSLPLTQSLTLTLT